MKKKVILLICDGLGDRPIPELQNKTPLEYAETPNMDRLAKNGLTGLMYTIKPGMCPGSDTAHLALLGYDPFNVYTGRGPFEAAGVGIELKKGDIAFRVNFATVDKNNTVLDRRAGRIKSTKPFEKDLNSIDIPGYEIIFRSGTEHRGALVVRGENLSSEVSANDPKYEGKKLPKIVPLKQTESAKNTASILNEYINKAMAILKEHNYNIERIEKNLKPANALLIRGCGEVPHIEPFETKFKMKAAVISGASFYSGIGKMLGMNTINVKGATGGIDSDYNAKISAALDNLDKFDFIFIHIKATDNMGHDGNFMGKVQIIEKIDKALEQINDKEYLFVLTADHSTPCSVKNHSGDPVPLLIYDSDIRIDTVSAFNEISVASGALGHIIGKDLLPLISVFANRAEKFGA